jgi:VanZ family protein
MIRILTRKSFWLASLVSWFCLLFYLSSRTQVPDAPVLIPHIDKIFHFTYFAAGGFCLQYYLMCKHKNSARYSLQVLIFALLVGALDEYHQTFTPHRSGNDIGDLTADVLGSYFGGWMAWISYLILGKTLGLKQDVHH